MDRLYFAITSRKLRRILPAPDIRFLIPVLVFISIWACVEVFEKTDLGLQAERAVVKPLVKRAAAVGLRGKAMAGLFTTSRDLSSSSSSSRASLPPPRTDVHPEIQNLIKHYPFQPVRNQHGKMVNIILVRSPFRSPQQKQLYLKYKDEILFIGISSFEDFPEVPPNPYSRKFDPDEYVGLFPGFLHMVREPEKVFPSHVKYLIMSQSDFSLPNMQKPLPKKYDFAFSGSDQDVRNDCDGWSSYAKNWTLVKQSLEVMCRKGMTGVLVATKDKADRKACTIPASCEGLILQTKFLDQDGFFSYVRQSKFLFLPQVHDASPRVSTQALALDVPLLMNWHIKGGWKYLNEETGEFFHDTTDIEPAIDKLLAGVAENKYHPQTWVTQNYGTHKAGQRLKEWIEKEFSDRVLLPRGTTELFPAGA